MCATCNPPPNSHSTAQHKAAISRTWPPPPLPPPEPPTAAGDSRALASGCCALLASFHTVCIRGSIADRPGRAGSARAPLHSTAGPFTRSISGVWRLIQLDQRCLRCKDKVGGPAGRRSRIAANMLALRTAWAPGVVLTARSASSRSVCSQQAGRLPPRSPGGRSALLACAQAAPRPRLHAGIMDDPWPAWARACRPLPPPPLPPARPAQQAPF